MASRRKIWREFRGPRMRPCARHSIPQAGKALLSEDAKRSLNFSTAFCPAVGSLKFLHYYTGDGGWVAGQAEISLANSKTLYVLDAFLIDDGEIIEQQNHYDPRPAT